MEIHNLPDITVPPGQNLPANHHAFNYYNSFESKISLRSYWSILLKRKWWVIGTFLAMVTMVGLYSFLMTPIYMATSILQITQDNPAMAGLMGDRDPLGALFASETQGRFYETQYMLLNSRAMAYRIMDSLNMMETTKYKELKLSYPDKSQDELRGKFAKLIIANLTVKPLKRSFLVELAFTWEDKHLAQQVLRVISDEYMKFSMETRRQSYELIKNWLQNELHELAVKVEESEKKVYAHGKQKDFLAIEDSKENSTIKKYTQLNLLLTKAQSERMSKEAQYKQIKEKGVDAPLITNNPLIQKLREEVITQEARVSSMNKIFDQNYPQLQVERSKLNELNQRLNNEVRRVRTAIEADYEAGLRTENLLNEAFAAQKEKVSGFQDNLVKHHILKRDMQTNEQLYQGLLARMKETSVASTMVASNTAVIVPAELPSIPFKPKKLFNLFIASIIGLIGGIGLAFFVEHLDDSIKTSKEMEKACGLATLGVIPLYSGDKETKPNVRLLALNEPAAQLTEAIRQVRTAVMLSSLGGPPVCLAVTSPNPNEGKTTVAVNIAASMALQGRKIVLVDADLRRPVDLPPNN